MGLGCFLFQVRSETITTYALCGFANFSSLGIMIGALCELFFSMVPNDKTVTLPVLITDSVYVLIPKPPCAPPEEVKYHL